MIEQHRTPNSRQPSHLLLLLLSCACGVLMCLSACEYQHEGVEVVSRGCSGYEDPHTHVGIAVRAQRINDHEPTRFLLSLKLMYERGGPISLEDPRIWPTSLDPSGPVNPEFEGVSPSILLRVGEIDVSGEPVGEWTVMLPSATPPVEPRVLVLDPSVELSFLWFAPKPGRYTLQAISGAYGSRAQWTTESRCQGEVIDPICSAQTFTEFHFEVPP